LKECRHPEADQEIIEQKTPQLKTEPKEPPNPTWIRKAEVITVTNLVAPDAPVPARRDYEWMKNNQEEFMQLPQRDQKVILGETLYPKIKEIVKDDSLVPKLTGMLIDFEVLGIPDIRHMIESTDELKGRVEEAIEIVNSGGFVDDEDAKEDDQGFEPLTRGKGDARINDAVIRAPEVFDENIFHTTMAQSNQAYVATTREPNFCDSELKVAMNDATERIRYYANAYKLDKFVKDPIRITQEKKREKTGRDFSSKSRVEVDRDTFIRFYEAGIQTNPAVQKVELD
jgi:hypothetical protein